MIDQYIDELLKIRIKNFATSIEKSFNIRDTFKFKIWMLITIQNIFIRLSLKHFLSIMCCLQINLLYKDESDLSKFPLSGYTFKTIRLIGQLNVV